MIVDTSVLLAVAFDEARAAWCADQLDAHAGSLHMSTVNLTEFLILLEDRQPRQFAEARDAMLSSGIRFVPPTVAHAEQAARARLTYPLNLGDCFCYALALALNLPIVTLDTDFARVDHPVVLP